MQLGSLEDQPSSCPVLEIRWKSFEIRSCGEWWLIIVLMTSIKYCPEYVNTPIPSFCRGISDDKNKARKNGWRSLFGKKYWEHIFFKPCPTQTLQKRVYLSFLLWPNATAFKWFCYARHSVYTKTKQKTWIKTETRFSWLNCALRDYEAVYLVSIGRYEAVAVGNWWYWVSRGHSCLYILQKVEIWTGVTDAWQTDWLTVER